MTTSSVNPGYDEFGNDINECEQDPCPEGYTCINLPGSFLCEGVDIEFTLEDITDPGFGLYHYVYGYCI